VLFVFIPQGLTTGGGSGLNLLESNMLSVEEGRVVHSGRGPRRGDPMGLAWHVCGRDRGCRGKERRKETFITELGEGRKRQ
jgi:hypothetical protein